MTIYHRHNIVWLVKLTWLLIAVVLCLAAAGCDDTTDRKVSTAAGPRQTPAVPVSRPAADSRHALENHRHAPNAALLERVAKIEAAARERELKLSERIAGLEATTEELERRYDQSLRSIGEYTDQWNKELCAMHVQVENLKAARSKTPAAAERNREWEPLKNVAAPEADVIVVTASWCKWCKPAIAALEAAGYRVKVVEFDAAKHPYITGLPYIWWGRSKGQQLTGWLGIEDFEERFGRQPR